MTVTNNHEPGEPTFIYELAQVINKHSQENASNTPDFILAQYLQGCMDVFTTAIQQRETWYDRDPRPCNTRPFKG